MRRFTELYGLSPKNGGFRVTIVDFLSSASNAQLLLANIARIEMTEASLGGREAVDRHFLAIHLWKDER